MAAPPRAASTATARAPSDHVDAETVSEDDVRALIALAALGGPDRLAHHERLALGRALEASPGLRAELRALAAVAAALPPPAAPPSGLDRIRAAVPPALLRVEVIAALAVALLLLGVVRVASGAGSTASESVVTATATTVDATADVVERPWGVEIRLVIDGSDPGEGYEVAVSDHAGGSVAVGSFAGDDGPVRFVGTAGVPRDELAVLQVTDASGDVILRAELP